MRPSNHCAREYVRGLNTNSVEDLFGVLKLGIGGINQRIGSAQLHRHGSEYEFRFNNRVAFSVNDKERAGNLLLGVEGMCW